MAKADQLAGLFAFPLLGYLALAAAETFCFHVCRLGGEANISKLPSNLLTMPRRSAPCDKEDGGT